MMNKDDLIHKLVKMKHPLIDDTNWVRYLNNEDSEIKWKNKLDGRKVTNDQVINYVCCLSKIYKEYITGIFNLYRLVSGEEIWTWFERKNIPKYYTIISNINGKNHCELRSLKKKHIIDFKYILR